VLHKADPALVDPGVTAQLERLLDEVLVGQTEMMGAIDAVCAQASRIIDRLTERAASGVAPLVTASASGPAGADRPPTPAMKAFVDSLARQKGLKPPRGYTSSGAICRAFLDQHASPKAANTGAMPAAAKPTTPQKRGKAITPGPLSPVIRNTGRKRQKGTKTGDSQPASKSPAPTNPSPGETRLNIPYGNKDMAQKLGARYRDGAWYGPAGVDLAGFRDRGWL